MKQFSAPTTKMIVSNNDKVFCPSLPQPDGREVKWIPIMTKAPAPKEIVLLVKCGCERTDAHTIDATAENQAWITPTSESCCDSDDPCEKACEDTSTLKIEDEYPDSEV